MKILFSVLILISSITYSQNPQFKGGTVSGRVIDASSSQPVEYANIVLYHDADSTQTTGGVSAADGTFTIGQIRPGKYYADVLFMGYERERVGDIQIGRNSLSTELGDIRIHPSSLNMGDVVVEGDRPALTYQIDKKVINVDQLGPTTSGTAADVLENVPSVTVDVEGNVSLRGSSNFTVLIDGRPSIMDPQDILQQISATSIQSIEIITNPSAKYSAEGTAGIINIILKKQRTAGISGIANANLGLNEKYGGDVLFEYKNEDVSMNIGGDYNNRLMTGTDQSVNTYFYEGNTSTYSASGDSRRNRESYGIKGGVDFTLTENDLLSLGGRYSDRNMSRNAAYDYENSLSTGTVYFNNNSFTQRGGSAFSLNLGYRKKFNTQGHELSTDLVFSREKSKDFSVTEDMQEGIITNGKKTTEEGPGSEFEGRLDYVLPLNQTSRVEAGYEGQIETSDELTGLQEYDTLSGSYLSNSLYDQNVRFEQNEHSLYGIYSASPGQLGYQLGIRGEYTKNYTGLRTTGQTFNVDRWDYFPSVHLSYTFSPEHQIMASYTGRINRPGGWALEPFITWVDANTVRQGNPELLPELIDSYELGGQTLIGQVSVNTDFYYHHTKNKMEPVRSVYAENVTLQSFQNVGDDYSLGTELMVNFRLFDFWDISTSGTVYDYRMEGSINNEPFSRSSFNWRGRINNIFRIAQSTQLQLNFMYMSPSVSSQGRREEMMSSDLALRQDLFDKKLSLILQVRNLFGASKFQSTSEGAGFYSYNSMKWEAPVLMLTAKFNINSYQQDRKRERDENTPMEGEDSF